MNINHLKNELLQSKRDLEERLQKMKDHIQHKNVENDPDFEEQAIQNANDDVVNELSDSLQLKLSEIRHALKRIDDGSYGICSSCGESISIERLDAIPHTSLCKECMADNNNQPGSY